MKIGFVVNPWAGIGGTVALKGSDGENIRNLAIQKGATPRAGEKALITLQEFKKLAPKASVHWYCAAGPMGADWLSQAGFDSVNITTHPVELAAQTEAEDTQSAVRWCVSQGVDLVLFAGGDGTARNICDVLNDQIPVLGIPAGVKIHSGVYAVTPHAAGDVLAGLVNGNITELHLEEVRDIDEDAFRENKVIAKFYGEMNVPVSGEFMQHVKVGGIEDQGLVLNDIADWFTENLDDNLCYFIGSGKSTATLMDHLGLENTLLGIDAVYQGQVIQADCSEADLLNLLSQYDCRFVLSIIGGQGHIFGRGNAQISPAVIRKAGKANFLFIGTKAKLKTLEGRPLLVDTSDPKLDQQWCGLLEVITGYNDRLIYPVETK